jgi:hypothetical protein
MKEENSLISRKRRITGNVLIGLGGLVLTASAASKLVQVPRVMAELGAMGLHGNNVLFIAALEVVSALLFLVPVTRSAGLLLVSSFLGGAIATHLQHGQPIIQPSFVLILIWLGAWLRHPVILRSLASAMQETGRTAAATVGVRAS